MEKQLNSRNVWGLLLVAFGALMLFGNLFNIGHFMEDLIGAAFLCGFALGFYALYLRNKQHWGWMIPAYIFGVSAVAVLISTFPFRLAGDLAGAWTALAFAAPFFYIYLKDNKRWWALIPGGLLALGGISALAGVAVQILPVALIIVGIYLLVRQTTGSKEEEPLFESIRTGPEADRAPEV